ncbi:nicotinamide-nucleotide amidase [Burkholderiales bacterium]|nr:nicotinamide-nucleotide amidase [Burkholderiales bacterium]
MKAAAALVEDLATRARARGLRLATAESCTGGMLAAAMTSLAGSSDWFERGYVTYSNTAKTAELGVPAALIESAGAVSEAVARAMALGARVRSGAAWAVALTGVAGPGGGSADKPVGTVWIAWAGPQGEVSARCFHFVGDRAAVREQAVSAALTGLIDAL